MGGGEVQSLLSSGTARTSKNMQSFDFKTNWDLQVAPLTVTLLTMTPPTSFYTVCGVTAQRVKSCCFIAVVTSCLPQVYVEYIRGLPICSDPCVFGLHSNADITKDNQETNQLLEGVLLTLPRQSGGGAKSPQVGTSAFFLFPSFLDPPPARQALSANANANVCPLPRRRWWTSWPRTSCPSCPRTLTRRP